jgi:FtsP/CotA-like multicopper oxidase with cupredoxin domain
MLKEIQVLAGGTVNFDSGPQPVANGEVLNQEDTSFCAQTPATGEVRQGSCPGQDNSATGGNNFTGGNWYMTVNGQQFPTVPVTAADGEVWRVATGAGSLSWDLQLVNDATNNPMTVQLIAVDGVAVHLPQDTTPGAMVQMAGGRFKVVPCPDVTAIGATVPVCVNEIVMMPSSRTEFWVTYRDGNGRVAQPPHGASATLKMVGLTMGTGDAWPAVDLAKVLFNQSGPRELTSNRVMVDGTTDAAGLHQPTGIFKSEVPGASALAAVATAEEATATAAACAPLRQGHHRRIFFGFSDVATNNTFALGYEEVDRNGTVVPGSQKPAPDQLERFDPSHTTVCVPLGPGQTPVTERWELVQLSTENHNFHIHQTRFAMAGSNGGVLQDNFLLGVAAPDATIADQVSSNQNGVCTIAQWRSGHCVSTTEVFDIPFAELGEFVYHCHILEHEDGGMMARIRVVPAPH